jgi:hypothetical protein
LLDGSGVIREDPAPFCEKLGVSPLAYSPFEPKPKGEQFEPRKAAIVEVDTVLKVADNKGIKVNLVNPEFLNHRGRRCWRVYRDTLRNLGDPYLSLLGNWRSI